MYFYSYWEVYKQTRKSISGWESFLEGCIIIWGSRGQNIIDQIRTETEIVLQNEYVWNHLFIKYIIEFLYNNLDIKDLLLRYLIVDKIVRTKFIKSEENRNDSFTNDLSEKNLKFLWLYKLY